MVFKDLCVQSMVDVASKCEWTCCYFGFVFDRTFFKLFDG